MYIIDIITGDRSTAALFYFPCYTHMYICTEQLVTTSHQTGKVGQNSLGHCTLNTLLKCLLHILNIANWVGAQNTLTNLGTTK